MVKIGKFSGDVLQTQIEETIEEALRASQTEDRQKQASEVFDAHEVAQNESKDELQNILPQNERSEEEKEQMPTKPASDNIVHNLSTPTYAVTEFLSSDTKIVVKKLVEFLSWLLEKLL